MQRFKLDYCLCRGGGGLSHRFSDLDLCLGGKTCCNYLKNHHETYLTFFLVRLKNYSGLMLLKFINRKPQGTFATEHPVTSKKYLFRYRTGNHIDIFDDIFLG